MHSRFRLAGAVVLVGGLSVAFAGCGQYSISNIRALKAFKDANDLYKKSEFKAAAAGYEDALQRNPDFYGITYFFLGNSYDNLYKPAKAGEAENDAYLQKAVENYKLATEKIKDTDPQGPQIRKLAYEYLIATYNDKMHDLEKAEPVAKQLISIEPNEPQNYEALGKLYEDSGRYDEAEAQFLKAVDIRPTDPTVYQALAGYYNRQGNFDKTMEAWNKRANAEPNNPEAWHTIASYYADNLMRNKTLTKEKQKEFVDKGLAADDKALALNGEYFEALSYKNILLHFQANLEKDPVKQKALLQQADDLRNKAMEIQKKQNASGGPTTPKGRGGE
ncbi:MAG TPA: tetratricopeptide repeat protein [Vicinamibacterales bacterium]|nr:tetratricopeptide repeat protein [Vicinamibacterales bacterium]